MKGTRGQHVLVVVDALVNNGSIRWAHQLAALWLRSGWAVEYLSLRPGADTRGKLEPPAGASVLYGDTAVRRFRWSFPRALLRAVRAATRADVVLVVSEVGLSVPFGYLVARLTRRRFVIYVQSIPEHAYAVHVTRRKRPLWRYCLTHADAVLCVSPVGAESAARLGVEWTRITVAPTGIDVDATRRLAGVDGNGRAPAGPAESLVACGELYRYKGYDLLIEALAEVHADGWPVRLTLIGQGGEEPALRRLAAELGVSSAVTFRGQLHNPLPEMARAGLFVHCARVEAVGLVMLEALSLGIPIVAADCPAGGPHMVLDGGKFGRLVEPESTAALAEAIRTHLEDPTQLARQATEAEAHLREQFLPERTARIVLDVLTGS